MVTTSLLTRLRVGMKTNYSAMDHCDMTLNNHGV
jgi:hypothetical protein